jgi:hypothetical protein
MTRLLDAFRNFAKEPKICGNKKREPSAVLRNVYTKWTDRYNHVCRNSNRNKEFSTPTGWIMLFKRISKIGRK